MSRSVTSVRIVRCGTADNHNDAYRGREVPDLHTTARL